METLFYVILVVLALVALVNYFKGLSPELRKEQLRTYKNSAEIVVGFTLTTGKDLIKTAAKSGKAGAIAIERNHAEVIKSMATSVDEYVATKGKGNALRAGATQSKEFQDHIGLNSIDEYLDSVISPTK